MVKNPKRKERTKNPSPPSINLEPNMEPRQNERSARSKSTLRTAERTATSNPEHGRGVAGSITEMRTLNQLQSANTPHCSISTNGGR
jgi:hypothetical protein